MKYSVIWHLKQTKLLFWKSHNLKTNWPIFTNYTFFERKKRAPYHYNHILDIDSYILAPQVVKWKKSLIFTKNDILG